MPSLSHHPTLRGALLRIASAPILISSLLGPSSASAATTSTFVPIGAGYTAETLDQFAAEAASVDGSGEVSILVLPIT